MNNPAWTIPIDNLTILSAQDLCRSDGFSGSVLSIDDALIVTERTLNHLLFHPGQEKLWRYFDVYRMLRQQSNARFGETRGESRQGPAIDPARLLSVAVDVDRGTLTFDPEEVINSCQNPVEESIQARLFELPRDRFPACCFHYAPLTAVLMVALSGIDTLVFNRVRTDINPTTFQHSLCGIEDSTRLRLFDMSIYNKVLKGWQHSNPRDLALDYVFQRQQMWPVERYFTPEGPIEIVSGVESPDRNTVRFTAAV